MKSTEWKEIKEVFIAAFELAEPERGAFLNSCRADLRLEVEKLLDANNDAEDFIREPAMVEIGLSGENSGGDDPDLYVGKQIDSYRIIRRVGDGGMGTVYLANRADESFDKPVAVKLIKRGMDTSAVLKRFVMERQILANLEHAHIAGLLDGGSTADGLPYLVMEYVEGEPITKFCDAHQYTTFERLGLFRKVCSAVSHAHQNLVVHRDIKPSNILVTVDGEPKLLDFGIAKLLHPDWSLETAEATVTMHRIMTPEYASPEQMRGLPITTASDVYSLGVVLYELLSGERPYKIHSRLPDEAAQIVLTEKPIKPSSVVSGQGLVIKNESNGNQSQLTNGEENPRSKTQDLKSLRGDLDNIILKALRKEPERRYASVHEFSEDIRRHLAGLPVTATADTFSYRIERFVKRHRAGVLTSGLIVLTLLSATAITAWQAVVAVRERDRAGQRFNQVRKLANTVLFEYHDGIAKLAGSTPLRERMVKDALEYLNTLAKENIDDALLQSELATAYFKVGEVQGAPAKSSLGDYGGGLESFKKSLAIREKLYADAPQNEQLKIDLIQSHQMVGHLSQVTDDIPAALSHYRQAFAIFDSMPARNLDAKRSLAMLHTRNGAALSSSGELVSAIENFRRAIVITDELVLSNPDNRDVRRDLGLSNALLGDALEEAGNLDGAIASQRAAVAAFELLIVDTDAQSKRDLNAATGKIGDVLFKMGKHQEALVIQLKATAVDEELLKSDPKNALLRRDVQVDFYKLGRIESELGNMNAALKNQRRCIDFCEEAVAANPESSESRGDLGVAYYFFGAMHEKNNDLTAALEYYKKATEIEEAMSAADPTNTAVLSNVSEDYLKVSDVALKLGNRAEALAGYLKALLIREKLAAGNQENAAGRAVSAKVYESLGDYYFSQSRIDKPLENFKEAKHRYEQSLAVWNDLSQKSILLSEDAAKPDAVRQKITKCDQAL